MVLDQIYAQESRSSIRKTKSMRNGRSQLQVVHFLLLTEKHRQTAGGVKNRLKLKKTLVVKYFRLD